MTVMDVTPSTPEQERSLRHLGLTLVAVVVSLILLGSFVESGTNLVFSIVWVGIAGFNIALCARELVKALKLHT